MRPERKPRVIPVGITACEEIRREDNGKLFLIGTYLETIGVQSFPSELRVQLLLYFELEGSGFVEFQIKIQPTGPEKAPTLEVGMEILDQTAPYQFASFVTPPLTVKITQPGEITISCRNDEEDWKTLRVFPVEGASSNDKHAPLTSLGA